MQASSSSSKVFETFSEKDIQLFKKVYRQVIEQFYDNPQEQHINNLIILQNLLMETISTQKQSKKLTIKPMLEILKVKSKNIPHLLKKTEDTIKFLEKPFLQPLSYNTIVYCLQKPEIFSIGCISAIRFYSKIVQNDSQFDWKNIISQLSKNCSINTPLALEFINLICYSSQWKCKLTVKSGFCKFIFSVYLNKIIDDKFNLFQAIKFLRMIAKADRTIMRDREKSLALVIYKYDQYIPICSQICQKCYDEQYCCEIQRNKKWQDDSVLDQLYLWSYLSTFSQEHICNQSLLKLQSLLNSKDCNHIRQDKIYAIFSNVVKNNKYDFQNISKQIPKHLNSIMNYMKFLVNSVEKSPKLWKEIDFNKIQKLVDQSTNPKVLVLFKYLKQNQNQEKKIKSINSNRTKMFTFQENADLLMQQAAKVPNNKDSLNELNQIMQQKSKSNEFESETLKSIQSKGIESLMSAVIQRKELDINSVLCNLALTDIKMVSKFLQVLQVYLMMNFQRADTINKQRVIDIITWIQQKYQGQDIDWGSIGQLLEILNQPTSWLEHLNQLPKKCYWLLAMVDVEEQDQNQLIKKIKTLMKSQDKQVLRKKLPMMIGFIGKNASDEFKCRIIEELPEIFQLILANLQHEQYYATNLLMCSYFFRNWKDSKKPCIFEKAIQKIHPYVLKHFRATEQEYLFLNSCLPYKLNSAQLSDNLDYLINQYGDLASYVYNKGQFQISYDKIGHLMNITDSNELVQILKFVEKNSSIIQSDELQRLVKNLFQKKNCYWQLYPSYITIMTKIIQIIGKSQNPHINNDAMDMLYKILSTTTKDKEISEQEKSDIYKSWINSLHEIIFKGSIIDYERIIRIANHIKQNDSKSKIYEQLELYKEIKKKQEQKKQEQKRQKQKKQKEQRQQIQKKQGSKKQNNKYQQVKLEAMTQEISSNIDRNYMTRVQGTSQIQLIQEIENKQQLDKNQKDMNQLTKQLESQKQQDQTTNINNMTVIQALKLLKKIGQEKQPAELFPKTVEVFMNNQLNQDMKDLLGNLLVIFYTVEKNKTVIDLLMMKNKTSLGKQSCYFMMSNNLEAFVLAQRWKLVGHQWMDLAMVRVQQGFIADGCQVVEYNLSKLSQIEYFHFKKYQEIISRLIKKIDKLEDAIYYLLLVATSARLSDVKIKYIRNNIHVNIMKYIERWPQNIKIIANIFYALSSLVYMQPDICLQILNQKNNIITIFKGFQMYWNSRVVVESGGCLIANLAYSNNQVKQILRKHSIIKVLNEVFENNLKNIEISIYKQLLRAYGNLSLSFKCAEQMIDSKFCTLLTILAEKLDIFIHHDENKLKLMKLMIDLIANMSLHKYKLEELHNQGITLLIITLLETTQTNIFVIMGCIDTIDGLCQNKSIENYVVSQKKLPYILIDVLKIQQDEKVVVKAARLLTNLTISPICIPYILQANLLSVLANIVMPTFYQKQNKSNEYSSIVTSSISQTSMKDLSTPRMKIQTYIYKILTRIHNSQPDPKLILKSGYLDCLVRSIQTSDNLEDTYLDILLHYAKSLPNFLNKRAFICLIKVLTKKHKNKQIVEKCLKLFKILLSHSYDRDEEDVVIEGSPTMYDNLLNEYQFDVLYLLGLHVSRSFQLRKLLRAPKNCKVVDKLAQYQQNQSLKDISTSVLFIIYNDIAPFPNNFSKSEEDYYKILKNGFTCTLYRIDGSYKKAKIDMNEQYLIQAYKYPDGEVKKKYCLAIRHLWDWQFGYNKAHKQWKFGVFGHKSGLFSIESDPSKCATIIGGLSWGEIAFINIEFEKQMDKNIFYEAFTNVLFGMRG